MRWSVPRTVTVWGLLVFLISLVTWRNIQVSFLVSEQQQGNSPLQQALQQNPNKEHVPLALPRTESANKRQPKDLPIKPDKGIQPNRTVILGFSDYNYKDYALRWYRRLSDLGYNEHVIVASDKKAVEFFQNYTSSMSSSSSSTQQEQPNLRWEPMPVPPCIKPHKDPRGFRQQLFARRWKFVYEQLQQGHHVLLTDVDNVFFRLVPMRHFEEQTDVDVFHAYSTSYPTYVFEDMGLTVCGGMAWLRASPKVVRFVGTLLNKCGCLHTDNMCKDCICDDQVVLNEILWKGKHKVIWDRNLSKPTSLKDWQNETISGISSKTRHSIQVWNRSFAYRAPMPETCPQHNWVAMPLYVDRDEVVQVWDSLCAKT